ncbi:MAG: hypothetical protein AAB341_02245 [Planctomycetota bacterium]
MRETGTHRRIVFDDTVPIDVPLAGIELDAIRRVFSELFDRAAQAVSRAGYDQDDAVVERSFVCRAGDATELHIAVEWLSDADRLAAQVVRALIAAGVAEADARLARIVGLKAVAILETLS